MDRYVEIQKARPRFKMLEFLSEQFSTLGKPGPKNELPTVEDPRFKEATALNTEQLEIHRELEKRLLGFLSRGQLVGIGYSLPRTPDARPAEIPQDVWTGRVKWDKDEVDGNGLRFIAVRVVRPQTVASTPQIQTLAPDISKGRPSRREQVEAAFWALDKEGRIPDFPDNKKSLFAPIIDKIDELFPEEAGNRAGLRDKTLYSIISNLLDARTLKRNE